MKIYTKTGDAGQTGLFGGGRVSKDHARITAYGTLDELNAAIGLARAEAGRTDWSDEAARDRIDAILSEAQNRLFDLGAELATPDPETRSLAVLDERHVAALEEAIDHHEASLPALRNFILPGGAAVAAQLHLARCVCRRAERGLVTLAGQEPIRELPLVYVNRLSDLLFVLARAANQAAGGGDTPWEKASG
ncbi:Cob(I)yrinic acid a,c-diamide adenosyltransferase [Planctomycetes bacterium MalM25]|nr:Cob(I)yrinic acid a,c-diamide adenosyltransferase [Planctomycetes bacterium MalM25]